MKRIHSLLYVIITITFTACVSNDFKVVDALQKGMTPPEAKALIASYGFTLEQSASRPDEGWGATENAFVNLAARARGVEEETGTTVALAEYYPVYHGLLGFGQLFLFYDDDKTLIEYYRQQIN